MTRFWIWMLLSGAAHGGVFLFTTDSERRPRELQVRSGEIAVEFLPSVASSASAAAQAKSQTAETSPKLTQTATPESETPLPKASEEPDELPAPQPLPTQPNEWSVRTAAARAEPRESIKTGTPRRALSAPLPKIQPSQAARILPPRPSADDARVMHLAGKEEKTALASSSALPSVAKTAGARTPSKLLGQPYPPYPAEARRRSLEGRVVVRFHVSPEGLVTDAAIETSSGHAILDDAAVRFIQSLRFQAARQDGQPVASEEWLAIRYRLE